MRRVVGNAMVEAGVENVLEGRQRGTNDRAGCIHNALQNSAKTQTDDLPITGTGV